MKTLREEVVAILNQVYYTGFCVGQGWKMDDKCIEEAKAADAIMKALQVALDAQAEEAAMIAEEAYTTCNLGWAGSIPKDAMEYENFEKRLATKQKVAWSPIEIAKTIRSTLKGEK